MTRTLRPALTVLCVAALLFVAASKTSDAALHPSVTIKAGTKIACVLNEAVNSATLKPGTDFKLRVVDPSEPSLQGAAIHGHVTDVQGPGGLTRARIGFVIDYIRFQDGTKAPIRATVLNRSVVYTNTAEKAAAMRSNNSPMLPSGAATPGPIAWQMRIGGGSKPISVGPSNTGQSGGYIYAKAANEQIVIPSGASVTIQLMNDLPVT